ncbi:hypothetical protein ACVIU7_004529 [Bradyrhizobium liaoningense]
MYSERSRRRVIGVRRSWLMAASIRVLSFISAVTRSRIRLSALAADRISSGPFSGNGSDERFKLKSSAARAKAERGELSARPAQTPSSVTLATRNRSVLVQAPLTKAGILSVPIVASSTSPFAK